MNDRRSIKIYILSFLLITIWIFGQKKIQYIDDLIEATNQHQIEAKNNLVFQNAKKILKYSEKEQYDKGLSYGNYYIASYFNDIAKFKESIRYGNKAQQYTSFLATDKTLNARISALLGNNYLLLELYTLSLKNFQETLNIINSIPNKNTIDTLTESSTYSHLSYLYENKEMYDSMYYYLNKERNILRNVKFKDAFIEKGCSCLGLGNYDLKLNKIDSAQYFYNRSIEFFGDKNHACKIESYIGLGNLWVKKKQYKEAEKYYQQALDSFEDNSYPDILCHLYEKLAEMYISQNNLPEAKRYQNLYLELKTELDARKKKERDAVLDEAINENNKTYESQVKKNKYITLFIISTLIIIILYIYYILKRTSSKNKRALEITRKLESEKALKDKETDLLKSKVNDAFEEVMTLAKDNNPEFFTRFHEVYPHFTNKMLNVNPKFRVSELTFAAYLYLGFTTKEIADYTFKAQKTIENNRYNLRKKLPISPEIDLQVWLRNYIDTE